MVCSSLSGKCIVMLQSMHNILITLHKLSKTYGYWGLVGLGVDVIYTRLFFFGARLVRRPAYVRGKSKISWGNGFTTGVGVRLDVFSEDTRKRLFFGHDVQLNDYVHIAAVDHVEIGNNVLIASSVFISDHNHGCYGEGAPGSAPSTFPIDRQLVAKPVFIRERVWIGEHACILPGVTIGEGSVVGAGSVVTHDIPPNSIVVGNPARVIRVFNEACRTWQMI